MSKQYEIKKSYEMIKLQTAAIAIVGLILFFTTSRIVRIIDNFIPADTSSLALLVRLTALVVGVLCVSLAWFRATRRRFYLEDNRLVIQNGGIYGSQSQEVIIPQHASKLRLVRSLLGNKLGFGSIIIEVESFSRKSVYELKNVQDPEKVIAELKARL
jgi:hypothetical protein